MKIQTQKKKDRSISLDLLRTGNLDTNMIWMPQFLNALNLRAQFKSNDVDDQIKYSLEDHRAQDTLPQIYPQQETPPMDIWDSDHKYHLVRTRPFIIKAWNKFVENLRKEF